MLPQRISAKFFFEPEAAPAPATFIPLFHQWIQEETVPGILIDVVDYRHVFQGPGVILVGHEGDYALDMGRGQAGLLYRRKRAWPETATTLASRLRLVLVSALAAVTAVEAAGDGMGQVAPRRDELELSFTDRLALPNNEASQRQVAEALPAALVGLYPQQAFYVHLVEPDPREPLRLRVARQPVARAQVATGGER